MACYQWNETNQCFRVAAGPIGEVGGADWRAAIREAGYIDEFDSEDEVSLGASIGVYRTDQKGKPEFFIDVWGKNTGLATFVADDFLGLLTTLQQLQPMLTLIGLDQSAANRSWDRAEREAK